VRQFVGCVARSEKERKDAHFILVFHPSIFALGSGFNGSSESSIVFNSGTTGSGGGGTGGLSGGDIAVGILDDNEVITGRVQDVSRRLHRSNST